MFPQNSVSWLSKASLSFNTVVPVAPAEMQTPVVIKTKRSTREKQTRHLHKAPQNPALCSAHISFLQRLTMISSRDNLRSACLSSCWSSCEVHRQSPAVSASLNQHSNTPVQKHTFRSGFVQARHRICTHELCPQELGPGTGWSVAGSSLERAKSRNSFWVKSMKFKQQTAVSLPHLQCRPFQGPFFLWNFTHCIPKEGLTVKREMLYPGSWLLNIKYTWLELVYLPLTLVPGCRQFQEVDWAHRGRCMFPLPSEVSYYCHSLLA